MINGFRKRILGILLVVLGLAPRLQAQTLNNVTLTPGNTQVGAVSIHNVSFTTSQSIPGNGRIVVQYPAGFDLSGLLLASSTTFDGSVALSVVGQNVTLVRVGGTATVAGQPVNIRLANVGNHQTAADYTVQVQTLTGGGSSIDAGTSSAVTFVPGSLDHFNLAAIGSPQTAGNAFGITIVAQDFYDNTVTSFTSTANLSDLSGSLSLTQTTGFTAGQWSGNVTVNTAMTGNRITATSGGKAGSSASFDVAPNALDRFTFGTIASPQTAGVWFSVTLTARDAYGNVQSGFTGTVDLSEDTGTLEVQSTGTQTTGAFTAGVWTGNVRITQRSSDNHLVATGSGQSGSSGTFNVGSAGVDHFSFSAISDQSAGAPFLVTLTAEDAYGNVATGFNSAVAIDDQTGTVSPNITGSFSQGVYNCMLTITQTYVGNYLAVNDGLGHTGQSATFDVISSTVDHFDVSAVASPQTAGNGFALTLTAMDINNNTVTGFNGTVNLRNETGTLSPAQATFSNGVWTGTVTATESEASDQITVTGLGKTSYSNTFSLVASGLDHFEINPIGSPQTAGSVFSTTLRAKDAYGNTVTTFTGRVQMSDPTGTLSPALSGYFAAGELTQGVIIQQARNDLSITVSDGGSPEHTGTSNLFNIQAGALNRFVIAQIADQGTGEPFAISVTAQDAQGNRVTSFTGSGATVNLTHSGSGSISPTVSGTFTQGVWVGNVTVAQTQNDDRITVTRTGGSESGQSNAFDVTPVTVDHFYLAPISVDQVAGTPFPVTLTAQDAQNNTVTSFNGTATLLDETGTNTPQQVTFVNGAWTGQITITRALVDNSLTVSAQGRSGTSNNFSVSPSGVASFTYGLVASPQTAGQAFNVTITAKDAFGNTATGFASTVTLTEATGTLSPSVSGSFTAGVRTESVTLTQSRGDLRITATDGLGHTGLSNYFNVLAGPVDHFNVAVSGNQIAGDPFTLGVTARDAYNNVATAFTGTVVIDDDLTHTVQPTISGSFMDGQWVGNVTVYQAVTDNHITVTRSGGSETGQSAAFSLIEPPGIRVTQTWVSQSTVTAGQSQNWTVKYAVTNLSGNPATLQSVGVSFLKAGQAQGDYTAITPAVFSRTQTAILAGGSTDTVAVVVDQTGQTLGDIYVDGVVSCLDSNTGRTVPAQGTASVTVQAPAALDIHRLLVSQDSVTVGQTAPWTLDLVVQNTGGATVRIDSAAVDQALGFSIGSGWIVARPTALNGGGWTLAGGGSDTLRFSVNTSGQGATGQCGISAALSGTELNTGRALADDTQDHGAASVLLESAPLLRIDGVKSLAPNNLYVNQGQNFWLRVYVRNFGEDAAKQVQVSLSSNGFSAFPQSPTQLISHLPGGERDSVDILVQASPSANPMERFTATAQGLAENTGQLILDQVLSSPNNFILMAVQRPAALTITQVVLSQSQVIAGQVDPWTIDLLLSNTGSASMAFDPPQASSIGFYSGNVRLTDYIVSPGSALSNGLLVLSGGAQASLRYTVTSTGRLGGQIEIRAALPAVDVNDTRSLLAEKTSSIAVTAETEFRIILTYLKTPNRTDAGNGQVDTGQPFKVVVKVENGLGETLRDVVIDLVTNGQSAIAQSRRTISLLSPSSVDSVFFDVTGAAEPGIEQFTAVVSGGERVNTGGAAPVGPALDATATATLQTPASLSLDVILSQATGQFSSDQLFTLSATLVNSGQGQVDGSGQVRVVLPEGYTLEPGQDNQRSIAVDQTLDWQVRAPVSPHSPARTAYVVLEPIPLALNTGAEAMAVEPTVGVSVQTIETSLTADVIVDSPDGAKDGILSTGQRVVIRATVVSQNVDRIEAEVSLPPGYTTADAVVKTVSGQEVSWQLQAPLTAAQARNLQVLVRGYDMFQPEKKITGQGDLLSLTTVARADLKLSLTTSDNSVSLGQVFTVTATLSNLGTAGFTGDAKVTLDALPTGYTTAENYTKSLVNGHAAWAIKAPVQPTQEAVNITARLTTVPLDENTNETVYVSQSHDKVAMTTVGAWLSAGILPRPDDEDGLVLSGETGLWAGAYKFINRGETGANGIVFQAMSFHLEGLDGVEITPNSLIASIRIVGMTKSSGRWVPNGNNEYGRVGGVSVPATNPLRIPFTRLLRVPAQDTVRLAVLVDVAESVESRRFVLNLKGQGSIEVRDEFSPTLEILVYDETGVEFDVLSSYLNQVMAQGADAGKPTLIPCPNPFGMAGKDRTHLVYSLPQASEVTFYIFTLTGELVWSRTYGVDTPQAQVGLHGQGSGEVVWDGRNDRGDRVLSGVYVCFLETDDGERVSTKIAVIY